MDSVEIVQETDFLLRDVECYRRMAPAANPYGDESRYRLWRLLVFQLDASVSLDGERVHDVIPSDDWQRRLWGKRLFDLALSTIGLLVSSPLWPVIAACIKLEDGGPVFYVQERRGKDCLPFWSWKFRSMVSDSDARFGPMQAKHGDDRITRVGRVLRATALDELPQLWNIFKGDMSFVGPRALMPAEIEVNGNGGPIPIEEIPGYRERHQVQPGLTGLAQVYAPRDVPRRYKFMYDLVYIRNRNGWLDIKLIALSLWITFRAKWESREKKF